MTYKFILFEFNKEKMDEDNGFYVLESIWM
uniref:Uncharacterized protein n=1 Tax=viral metagenome TaxID=1070528 RepID=A0A6C0J3W9_9ZZZZ